VRLPRLLSIALPLVACGEDRPHFQSVSVPEDTIDTVGPYLVEAYVYAERGLRRVGLRVSSEPTEPFDTEILAHEIDTDEGVELWRASLPGRPAGTRFHFHLTAVDDLGQKATYPESYPERELSFAIVGP
jgi:hypothetical protein